MLSIMPGERRPAVLEIRNGRFKDMGSLFSFVRQMKQPIADDNGILALRSG